jgi:hypothetical protein
MGVQMQLIFGIVLSPLRKVRIIRKWKILDDIFIFRTSVMPEHQGVENNGNIAKRAVSRYYDFLEWTQPYDQYWLGRNGGIKKFVNIKALRKLYKDESSMFKAYVKEHDLKYDDLVGVIKLIKYL